MADNTTPKPNAIDTDERIRVVVENVLSTRDFVTSAQVTALIEKQTDTFQSGLGSLRSEMLGSISGLRKDVFAELKEWRGVLKGQDTAVRNAEAQTERYSQLASEIKGQNASIEKTLDRFSNRLDTVTEELDDRLDEAIKRIEAQIAAYSASVKTDIDEVRTSVAKNTSFRERREAIEQGIAKYAGGLLKNTGFRWAVGVGASALMAYLGYSAATNSNVLFELVRILGGG